VYSLFYRVLNNAILILRWYKNRVDFLVHFTKTELVFLQAIKTELIFVQVIKTESIFVQVIKTESIFVQAAKL